MSELAFSHHQEVANPDALDTNTEAQFPSTLELYSQLISPDVYPEIELADGAIGTSIDIVKNNAILINGAFLKLTEKQIFVFNSVMLFRDQPRDIDEYLPLGFDGGADPRNNFRRIARHLFGEINELAGSDLVEYKGSSRYKNKFHVSQSLSVSDKRSAEDFKLPETDKSHIIPLIPVPGFERAHFNSLKNRNNTIKEIVPRYRHHPRVAELLASVAEAPRNISNKSELNDYIKFAAQYRLLKEPEVQKLFHRIEWGLSVWQKLDGRPPLDDEEAALVELTGAYNLMFVCNLRLVIDAVMNRLGNNEHLVSDMIQESTFGLSNAITRFDYEKGFRFSTYAHNWISQGYDRSFTDMGRAIRIPSQVDVVLKRIIKVEERLSATLFREPTDDEIAKELQLDPSTVNSLKEFGKKSLTSLDLPVGEDGDTTLGEMIPQYDDYGFLQVQSGAKKESHDLALEILNHPKLTERGRLMLSLKFGIFLPDLSKTTFICRGASIGYEDLMQELHSQKAELSDEEIGDLLGIKEETVNEKVRRYLNNIRPEFVLSDELDETDDLDERAA